MCVIKVFKKIGLTISKLEVSKYYFVNLTNKVFLPSRAHEKKEEKGMQSALNSGSIETKWCFICSNQIASVPDAFYIVAFITISRVQLVQ